MSRGQDDQVLMDYLATLLQDEEPQQAASVTDEQQQMPFAANDFPMMCLSASIGESKIMIPINQVAGMQALAGPLYETSAWQALPAYLPTQHGKMPLIDLSVILQIESANYLDSAWRGHMLKLKDLSVGILVDAIVGPEQQTNAPDAGQVQSLAWGDVAALQGSSNWLIANLKG
jgi:hypothetical protein